MPDRELAQTAQLEPPPIIGVSPRLDPLPGVSGNPTLALVELPCLGGDDVTLREVVVGVVHRPALQRRASTFPQESANCCNA